MAAAAEHAGEHELALAAAAGSQGAMTAIETRCADVIESVCRRFASASQTKDDLRQILVARLFVGEPERKPKIADYAGVGHLENWLRVTAVRLFLDLRKRKDRAREQPAADDIVGAIAEPGDLALDFVKAEYRAVVGDALRAAAAELASGERHLLRQHLVAGLTIDQLAAVLGINRATVARRIARAKEQLAAATRRAIAARLRIGGADLDSVIGLALSRLDVSIARLLASAP
jgi:RNA polymerase sigma-70 factor, ECF subfamily